MWRNVCIALLVVALAGTATLLLVRAHTSEGDLEVRVIARWVGDGDVELGVQSRDAVEWSQVYLPERRFLTDDSPTNRWLASSVVELPISRTDVDIALRPNAHIASEGAEFVVTVDGTTTFTNCGNLQLTVLGSSGLIAVETLDAACNDWIDIATVCADPAPGADCDPVAVREYAWERRGTHTAGLDIPLSVEDSQAIVDAISADFFDPERAPPAWVRHSSTGGTYYSQADHEIHLSAWGRNFESLLHELAHALVYSAGVRNAGHGSEYTATLLLLWERYAPTIDIAAMRGDARRVDLPVASEAPIRPRQNLALPVVRRVVCDGSEVAESLCSSYRGALTELHGAVTIEGLVEARGRLPGGWYGTWTDEDGRVSETNVVKESNIEDLAGRGARLSLGCEEDELSVEVWWMLSNELVSAVSVQIGNGEVQRETWVRGTGTWSGDHAWGDNEWQVVWSPEPRLLMSELRWAADLGLPYSVSVVSQGKIYTASFDLDGLFETPVQPNLARCGR